MIDNRNFDKIINVGINVVLGIALTLTGLLVNHMLTLHDFVTGFVTSMGVGYLICDLIPPFGDKVKEKIHHPITKNLVGTAITGFVYILLISFFNLFVSTGFHVMDVWPGVFPYVYGVGYVVLLVFMPIIVKVAFVLTKQE